MINVLQLLDKQLGASDGTSVNDLNQLQRLSLKVASGCSILPTDAVLTGVQFIDSHRPEIGGFANVYCGIHAGMKVALKILRVNQDFSEKKKIQEVS